MSMRLLRSFNGGRRLLRWSMARTASISSGGNANFGGASTAAYSAMIGSDWHEG
jgi:hypothetical protein